MPGRPPSVTYVRTLVSRKLETSGSGAAPGPPPRTARRAIRRVRARSRSSRCGERTRHGASPTARNASLPGVAHRQIELRGAGGEPVDLARTLLSHGVAELP